jgi:dihydrofolate synthase/folylpolyglutamate synthase
LYSSPHLHALEERYLIDANPASLGELAALIDDVREAVEELDRDDPRHAEGGSTFFEITTAMGLLHFARKDVGAVVLEVGMGGRLDSTNVVHPLVSVITSISLDHTRQLGNTLGAIATEKAGICKRGRPVISGVAEVEPRHAIRRIARERRCLLRELGINFSYEATLPEHPLDGPTPGFVEPTTWRTQWGRLRLPLLGRHQAHNAAVALAALDELAELVPALTVERDDVVRGFAALLWPARVEVLGERPWLVIDGAHNAASAAALADTLLTSFPRVRRTLVFGTTKDKDMEAQLRSLIPLFDVIVATRYIENARAIPPEDVAATVFELSGRTALLTNDPAEALEAARRATAPEGLICVTGSLFLAAESRAILLPHVRRRSITEVVT